MIYPDGGEAGFVARMVEESEEFQAQCKCVIRILLFIFISQRISRWYTSMLGKMSSVLSVIDLLRKRTVRPLPNNPKALCTHICTDNQLRSNRICARPDPPLGSRLVLHRHTSPRRRSFRSLPRRSSAHTGPSRSHASLPSRQAMRSTPCYLRGTLWRSRTADAPPPASTRLSLRRSGPSKPTESWRQRCLLSKAPIIRPFSSKHERIRGPGMRGGVGVSARRRNCSQRTRQPQRRRRIRF